MATVKTSDFLLASTLLTKGFDILGIDKSNPRRVHFIFRKTSDLEVTLKDYWIKKVTVVPQDFQAAEHEIKAKIHTEYE